MSKSVHNDVLDAALNYISTNADGIYICSQEPTTYTEAITTYGLGNRVGGPSFGAAVDGDVSGRKKQVNAVTDGSVTGDGTANHVALVDSGNSKLLYVTTIPTPQAVTNGNDWTLPSWDIEIEDPA
jgi:hypothetical protein